MVVVLSIVAVTAIGSNMTFARITQQDTSCTNGGGYQPGVANNPNVRDRY